MSFVGAVPEFIGSSARDLVGIGMTISNSNALAAGPTVALSAAAGDQVSAAVAAFFSGHARGYQTLSAQASEIHNDFVQKLSTGANNYAAAEAANAAPMDQPLDAATAAEKSAAGSPIAGAAGSTTGSGANGSQRSNGNGGAAGAQQRLGGGSRLTVGVVGGNSSTRLGESSGNERFGGLLFGNNDGVGSGTRLGNAGAAASGRVGGLLAAMNRTDHPGGSTLLRLADSGTESETTGAPSQVGGGRPRFGDPKGWLHSCRCVGGSGGQLRPSAADAEAGAPSVTASAGGNSGLSMGGRPNLRGASS